MEETTPTVEDHPEPPLRGRPAGLNGKEHPIAESRPGETPTRARPSRTIGPKRARPFLVVATLGILALIALFVAGAWELPPRTPPLIDPAPGEPVADLPPVAAAPDAAGPPPPSEEGTEPDHKDREKPEEVDAQASRRGSSLSGGGISGGSIN